MVRETRIITVQTPFSVGEGLPACRRHGNEAINTDYFSSQIQWWFQVHGRNTQQFPQEV
jgi:hypothetical protein